MARPKLAKQELNLAHLIHAYRTLRGLGLRKMSKLIGIDHQALHRFELGVLVDGPALLSILNWALDGAKTPKDIRNSEGEP